MRTLCVQNGLPHLSLHQTKIDTNLWSIYFHVLKYGGTLRQIDHEDMIIIMYQPKCKFKGFRRQGKSGDNPMLHNIIMFNKATGISTFVPPNFWTQMNVSDLVSVLNDLENRESSET